MRNSWKERYKKKTGKQNAHPVVSEQKTVRQSVLNGGWRSASFFKASSRVVSFSFIEATSSLKTREWKRKKKKEMATMLAFAVLLLGLVCRLADVKAHTLAGSAAKPFLPRFGLFGRNCAQNIEKEKSVVKAFRATKKRACISRSLSPRQQNVGTNSNDALLARSNTVYTDTHAHSRWHTFTTKCVHTSEKRHTYMFFK